MNIDGKEMKRAFCEWLNRGNRMRNEGDIVIRHFEGLMVADTLSLNGYVGPFRI
jgi:hypothetical protein